jgi:hypothetical protein
VARAQPEPARIVQGVDRGKDPIEVQEWLAHPHEHHVRQPATVGGQAASGMPDLVDDFCRFKIASEAELAGRAERAADGAAGLARDAQCVALSLTGFRRVVHEDRLDERPVRQAMKPLLSPASAVWSSVSATVSKRKPESTSARRAAGSVRASPVAAARPPQTASATWRAR